MSGLQEIIRQNCPKGAEKYQTLARALNNLGWSPPDVKKSRKVLTKQVKRATLN